MINKNDSLKAGLRPLLAKTLENALSHRIAKEFPRIGGPRICKLCAEMIMEVVNNHIRSKDCVHHGQIQIHLLAACWQTMSVKLKLLYLDVVLYTISAADYLINGWFVINVMLKVKVPIGSLVKLITVSSRLIATWDSSTGYDTVYSKGSIP